MGLSRTRNANANASPRGSKRGDGLCGRPVVATVDSEHSSAWQQVHVGIWISAHAVRSRIVVGWGWDFWFRFPVAYKLEDLYIMTALILGYYGYRYVFLAVSVAWNARVLCSRLEDQAVRWYAARNLRGCHQRQLPDPHLGTPTRHPVLRDDHDSGLRKVRFLVSDTLFKLPLVADLLAWAQCSPADKQTMLGAMKAGENLSILPGGYQEATLYRRNEHRVFIQQRKGFIKYALMHGYNVHPSYIFGEEKTYLAASWLQEKLMFLIKWKLPAVLMGKWLMFMLENKLDMVTMVGRPLALPLIEAPAQADIDYWCGRYMEGLQSVFDRNKGKYAAESSKAELVML
jgi:hypothetical protein